MRTRLLACTATLVLAGCQSTEEKVKRANELRGDCVVRRQTAFPGRDEWIIRRGLIRLFVVASVAWPISIGVIMAPKWAEGIRLLRLAHDPRGAKTVSIEEAYALNSVAQAEEDIALSAIYAFGPVIIAWPVLFAAFWVASGFQRQDRAR